MLAPMSGTAETSASDPASALQAVAAELRHESPEVAVHVADPTAEPVLGMLVASGPRCVAAPAEYAAVVESVREGFLLHYGEPRLLATEDADLRLLVGDHLYARGIERLVQLEDLVAVHELSDLISLSAHLDAAAEDTTAACGILWLASCIAIAAGPWETHERDKVSLRESGDPEPLLAGARHAADEAGLSGALVGAFEAVGSPAPDRG